MNAQEVLFVDGAYLGATDGSEGRPFRTIQSAVNAASGGDVIHIAAGEYPESVTVKNKAVLLRGMSAATVALSPPGSAPAISFYDVNGAEVSGLTIRHQSDIGFGVYARHSSVLIRRNVFEDNQVAVNAEDRSYGMFIERNVFRSNERAVVLQDVSGTVANNIFSGQGGVAISVRDSAPVHVRNNIIMYSDDFALEVRNSTVNILSNTIAYGQAGVALDLYAEGAARIVGNIIAFNRSYALQWTIKSRAVSDVAHNNVYGNGLDLTDQALRSRNMSADPLFEDPRIKNDRGYQLQPDSPCKVYRYKDARGRQRQAELGFSGDADIW